MPVLVIQHENTWRAGLLRGRVLIGRWSINHIAIDDQMVSKIHAWITGAHESFTITDGDSYNGTYVNGQRIAGPCRLQDKDRIRVGPTEMRYAEASLLPPGFGIIDLTPKLLTDATFPGGFIIECQCGAPLLVKETFKGKTGRCRFCKRSHLLVPHPSKLASGKPQASQPEPGTTPQSELLVPADGRPMHLRPAELQAPPTPLAAPRKNTLCSVCQSTITAEDAVTNCPTCGMAFHAECWTENRGCAAYGCVSVGALEPKTDDGDMVEQSQNDERF